MVRVAVSVEGTTEERFIKGVLVPHFLLKGIFLQPVSLAGNVSVDRVKSEVEKLIYNFDYVTTFYDFYGFKKRQVGETKKSLEQRMLQSIKDNVRGKLIPYIQMYEFEGLLFSSPNIIGSVLKDEKLIQWAEGILKNCEGNPEAVNDSAQTAPSKRLEKDTLYRKTIDGPDIAKEIGLDMLRDKCAGFDNWITQIEELAI